MKKVEEIGEAIDFLQDECHTKRCQGETDEVLNYYDLAIDALKNIREENERRGRRT